MRFVMKHQSQISFYYGALIVALCTLVVFNLRWSVKPLISLIIASIVFFYVDVDPYAHSLVSNEHLSHIQTLTTIIGGLFLVHGFSSTALDATEDVAVCPISGIKG